MHRTLSFKPSHMAWLLTLSVVLPLNSSQAETNAQTWFLMLAHDKYGVIKEGAEANIVNAVRSGCQLRLAWGGARADPPRRSVEHVADIKWVTVRDGQKVHAQIGDFLINLVALGEPSEDHPRRKEFGGTNQVVEWRATVSTDGSFNAVWFAPHSGTFITRRPQNHPMKWYADCEPSTEEPLYSVDDS